MRKLLAILLIAIVACATQEEEKTNLIEKKKIKLKMLKMILQIKQKK